MRDRFELFTMAVTRAYKYVQQIKKHESATFGIKGIHVMCMVALGKSEEGLTVTERRNAGGAPRSCSLTKAERLPKE